MNKRARLPDRIHHLKIGLIREGDRLRPVSADRVKEIAASWNLSGQLTPIEVGPADAEGMHTLVAGGHRLAVARQLGEATIAALIAEIADDDMRRLREIDENLYRAELNPLDQAVFLAARKEIYERLFPDAGYRKAPKTNAAKIAALPTARVFSADVAEKIGLAERTVRLALTRFERLTEESRQRLRGSAVADNGAELDALCKAPPAMQTALLDLVLPASGVPKATSVREARALLAGKAEPSAPDPEAVARKLERLFWQLPKGKARRDFAAWAKANIDRDPEGEA
jgi:ParB family chromosome partitioning protein